MTVKGYVDRVVVVAGGQVVAEHPRCYGPSQQVLDPVHFLAALGRRPAALDHAPMYRDWEPTAALAGLRRELEAKHGVPAGTRQFIRVLQLLGGHPQSRIERAIAACRAGHAVSAEAIVQRDAGPGGGRSRADTRGRSFMWECDPAPGLGPATGPFAIQPAAGRRGVDRANDRHMRRCDRLMSGGRRGPPSLESLERSDRG